MAHYEFDLHRPEVHPTAFIAPSADLIGRVSVGEGACVMFNAVLRGDQEQISLGRGSNIQDGVAVHADPGFPVSVGEGVSVGHNATIHGCQIGDNSLIGMGATVLNGATIGANTLVAAGSVVLEGQTIPPGSLVAGIPASVKRELRDDEIAAIGRNAEHYQQLARRYRDEGHSA